MLTTWKAFPILDRFLDDVMNDVTGTALGTGAKITFDPGIDVRATDDEIIFVCDVPGVAREELDVSIEGSTLTIKGQRTYSGGEKDRVWLGRAYGAFAKSFTLPELVDANAMTADLSNGVLTIHVPKKPQAKPRKIQIGSGSSHPQLAEKKE
ncbi:Hsp20/alpha crystallin family protein [Pendulispora albinea]|uniref:Hsp20/alpha crystallin family protein n=1 Tax=Pendulispora albinea TaxID=2741071 RepID=A0ABZ2LZ94_9BACT